MTKKLSFLLGVLVLSFAFGYLIFAWTEPESTPPGGNVPTPINVGSTAQTKTGDLTIGGSGWLRIDGSEGLYFQSYGGGWHMQDSTWIRSYGSKPVYIDRYLRADQGLYVGDDEYFYRNSEDFIRTGDHFQSDASVRAPIFYDSNNTGYYVNPDSTSNLNNVNVNGTLRIQYTRADRTCNNRYCKATCSSGWRVVGGGCESSGGVVQDDRPEYRWRSDWDRSWVCYGGNGVIIETAYAICLKIQQP